MNYMATTSGSASNHNRRRRRPSEQKPNDNRNLPITANYDDDDKRFRRGEDRIFKGSGSFGQFMLSCTKQLRILQKSKMYKRFGGDGRQKILLLLLFVSVKIVIFFTIGLPALHRLLSSPSASLLRPLTDQALNQIPVTITAFDFHDRDIGSWKHIRKFYHPSVVLDTSEEPPDYGELEMTILRKPEGGHVVDDDDQKGNNAHGGDLLLSDQLLSSPRMIHPDDAGMARRYWHKLNKKDPKVEAYDMYPEELEDTKNDCRAPNWAKKYRPQCNMMHELVLGVDYDEDLAKRPGDDQFYDSFYISHGAFRDVWVIHQPFPEGVKSALKMTRYKHDYNYRTFWNTLNDALVMERLTGSPRIVDIFGHCGGTVLVEAMPHEVEEIIIKGEGMAKQENLPKELTSFNDYTIEEKLDLALSMAESLADLHGFRDGVIVHDDVQLCQWLRTKDGTLKLGDFNRAEVMEYNQKNETYCEYFNGSCYGNYRAPEEYDRDYINEQIDVFSFGNNIYGILTGLWVFYDVDDDETVQKNVIEGKRAYIDPRWRKRSFIESKLVDLMEKCWKAETDERIDIFGAVKELREIKKEHEMRNNFK